MFADPLAETLWGTGYVIVLMRLQPRMAWLDRLPSLRRIVGFINARAITIYLWHLPAIYATGTLLAFVGVDIRTPPGIAAVLAITATLMAFVVAAVGWIEDLAARRLSPPQDCSRMWPPTQLSPPPDRSPQVCPGFMFSSL
jgi:peptidoglycan/LPS O-acetylase OafA/YrhL